MSTRSCWRQVWPAPIAAKCRPKDDRYVRVASGSIYAWRRLCSAPIFTLFSIFTLAPGIGASLADPGSLRSGGIPGPLRNPRGIKLPMRRLPVTPLTYLLMLALAMSGAGLVWAPTTNDTMSAGVLFVLTFGSTVIAVAAFAGLCA